MYRIKDIIEHTDKSLSLDFKGRICIKDPMSDYNTMLLAKSEYADDIVEKLNNILSKYKYSYYIEYKTIYGVNLPSYTEKNDDVKISIDYVNIDKCGYYILNIVDGNGKKVDEYSWFFKEEDYRNDEFNEEFARAKRRCLSYIENVKYTFNETMDEFNKSEYKI